MQSITPSPPENSSATSAHYDVGSMLLHWGVALLVLLVGISSVFLDEDRYGSISGMAQTFHYAAGSLALVVAVLWFVWRLMSVELPSVANVGTVERRIAACINGAINVLLFLVPITGIAYAFALGKHVDLGVTNLAFDLSLSARNVTILGLTHNVAGTSLLGLAFLHSLYGLWHHFKRRDQLLRRMLPWH